jgi:hypothetical protein
MKINLNMIIETIADQDGILPGIPLDEAAEGHRLPVLLKAEAGSMTLRLSLSNVVVEHERDQIPEACHCSLEQIVRLEKLLAAWCK